MCGFILCADKHLVSKENFRKAHEATSKRGSDLSVCQQVIMEMGLAYTGHNTLPLSSSDPTHYAQPKVNGSLVSVFVGEIFNFRDFMDHSENDQTSDTELAVATFELYRNEVPDDMDNFIDTVHQFDGFWNYASHESSSDTLVAFTDPLSQKPLYYHKSIRAVASDPYSLALLTERTVFECTVNERALSDTIKFGYSPDGSTPWNEIAQVPPGCVYVDGEIRSYWNWSLVKTPKSLTEAIRKSVSDRSFSYKSTGILLSGGLDSSIIYTVLRQNGIKPRVFHVANEDDTVHVQTLLDIHSDTLQPLHDISNLSKEDLMTLAVTAQRTPSDLGSLLLQYQLAKSVSDISVIYTGDGADELFGG